MGDVTKGGRDMRDGFLHGLKGLVLICGLFSIVLGCAGAPPAHETLMGEGFQPSLPKVGTRVVVWGNHSGAVTRTLRWLQDHHIQGIDPSWVEKELEDPGFNHRARMDPRAQVLAAAQSLGAPLVLFVHRADSQFGQKFDLMSLGHKRTKTIAIEIRGMKTETGDVVFGAKAWNSEPMVESDQMVQDLTTFALQKAWNEPDSLLPLQEEVVQQRPQQERVSVIPSSSEEMGRTENEPDSLLRLQEEVVQQRPQQERVSVIPSSSEEMSPTEMAAITNEVPTSETDAPVLSDTPLLSDEKPRWGLDIAGGALSLLYTPLKVGYAGLGGLMGGLAYVLTAGNDHVAQSIWDASLQGTYWLTAKHLQGEEPIQFKGEALPADLGHQSQVNPTMSVGSGVE